MDDVREIQGGVEEVSCMVNSLFVADKQKQNAAARCVLPAGQRQR